MSDIKEDSLKVIEKHFGQKISELYKANFEDKEDKVVLIMMRELLLDYLGEEQAQKELLEINNSSNQNEK
ncbi:MAG: hypothetical protein WC022_00300 [Parcubacteria group bacterium]